MRSKKSFVKTLNYIEHFLVLVSAVTRCTSTFTIASLVVIPIGVTSSAVALKFCAVTAAIKKYKSVIKKRLDHAKKSVTNALKIVATRAIQKIQVTCDLTGNKIADKITKISKSSLQNSSETVTNEHDKEISKDIILKKNNRTLLTI